MTGKTRIEHGYGLTIITAKSKVTLFKLSHHQRKPAARKVAAELRKKGRRARVRKAGKGFDVYSNSLDWDMQVRTYNKRKKKGR